MGAPPEAPAAHHASARSRAAPVPGPRPRRVRHTIKKVDLWSALKISLCFYVCEMAVAVTAIALLWLIADGFGVIGSVEKFIGDLLSSKDFKFASAEMLRGAILVGLVLVAIQVVATVVGVRVLQLVRRALRRHRGHGRPGGRARRQALTARFGVPPCAAPLVLSVSPRGYSSVG